VQGLHDKLVARHPHVFGDGPARDVASVVAAWDAIKAEEKQRGSRLDGIPASLPSLAWAAKLQKRAGSVVGQAPVGYSDEQELGAALWDLVAASVDADVDPESALRAAGSRFERRFRRMEQLAGSADALSDADASQLAVWWASTELDDFPA